MDELVALFQVQPDVYSARMTGADFGGAVVALVREGTAESVVGAVLPR
nr:hypothetical protein [Deinococcus phoenicis]